VRLTEAGEAITDKITTARRAMMRRALKGWNERELAALQDGIRHLAATIRDYTNTVG
jgi:DNA-binding MarR family transcriptional regulator